MLYAIASTGALSRGTMMPYDVTTVAEWNVDLLDRLHSELVQCAQEAKTGGPGEDDGPALREWADDVATVLAEWKTTAERS